MRGLRLAVLLCLVGVVAGCGGSDAPTTAGAGGPPAPGSAPPPPGDGGSTDGTPMEGTEGTPDGGQPDAGNPAEPMPPPDAAPMSESPMNEGTPPPDSPEATTPTPDASADPNQTEELNPDGTPRKPPKPKTLREQAIAAYSEGNDAEGQRLMQSHFIAVPGAKDELAKKMAWFPGLARPALGPRIGIAVLYAESSREFAGHPMPIGSAELASAMQQLQQNNSGEQGSGSRRSRNRGGEPATGGVEASGGTPSVSPEAVARATPIEQLRFYTGEFGEILLETIQERFESGAYGVVPKELTEETERHRRLGRDPNDPNNPGETLSTPDVSVAAPEPDGGAAGSARARRRTGRTAAGAAPDTTSAAEHVKQLSPGILWLGKADQRDDVIKRAEAAHVDVLAIFDVIVREARGGGFVNNSTRLRLLGMKQGFPPLPEHKPEPLVNKTVEEWRMKEQKGLDPVDREINKAAEALDKVLKPTALPEGLTAERAKKRIADLAAQKPEDPLPVLVEARFYAAKNLMPEEDFRSAAISLLGESGFAELQEKAKIGTE